LILSLLFLGTFCTVRVLKEETSAVIKSKADWESYDIHENPFKDYTESQVKSLLGTTLMWDNHNLPFLIDNDDHSLAADLPK